MKDQKCIRTEKFISLIIFINYRCGCSALLKCPHVWLSPADNPKSGPDYSVLLQSTVHIFYIFHTP
jgi:hypothetical protein